MKLVILKGHSSVFFAFVTRYQRGNDVWTWFELRWIALIEFCQMVEISSGNTSEISTRYCMNVAKNNKNNSFLLIREGVSGFRGTHPGTRGSFPNNSWGLCKHFCTSNQVNILPRSKYREAQNFPFRGEIGVFGDYQAPSTFLGKSRLRSLKLRRFCGNADTHLIRSAFESWDFKVLSCRNF